MRKRRWRKKINKLIDRLLWISLFFLNYCDRSRLRYFPQFSVDFLLYFYFDILMQYSTKRSGSSIECESWARSWYKLHAIMVKKLGNNNNRRKSNDMAPEVSRLNQMGRHWIVVVPWLTILSILSYSIINIAFHLKNYNLIHIFPPKNFELLSSPRSEILLRAYENFFSKKWILTFRRIKQKQCG